MNWKKKLTSRKMWAAIASFAALLVIAFGYPQATATQVTALIMAGATVVAYIVGEGLIDAASAGATVNINGDTPTAGQQATTPDSASVVGTVDSTAPESAPTGATQAAEAKQDTAGSGTATFPGLDNVTLDQVNTAVEAANIALGKATDAAQQAQLNSALAALKVLQAAKAAESGAVAPNTNGAA
jgi:hypothetical protein